MALLCSATLAACGESSDDSLSDVGSRLQGSTLYDYITLADADRTLSDLAESADVVGIGRIVDVRLGYSDRLGGGEPDFEQHMFLVIEPSRLLKGNEKLGDSGVVLLDRVAPALARSSGSRGISELRADAVSSKDAVAFILVESPRVNADINFVDEFKGRAADDPLLRPAHPAAVLGISDQDAVAYPLLVGEQIAATGANTQPFTEMGAEVEKFTTLPPAAD